MSLKGERMGRGREEHFHLGIYTNYNGVCDSMNISLIKRPPDGHPNQGQASGCHPRLLWWLLYTPALSLLLNSGYGCGLRVPVWHQGLYVTVWPIFLNVSAPLPLKSLVGVPGLFMDCFAILVIV